MYGCNYYDELNVLSGYMCCSRFKLPLPDRNRHVPDRYVPFPIPRNIAFVFPSDYPVPVPVPGKKKKTGTEMVWVFFRPFPTVFIPRCRGGRATAVQAGGTRMGRFGVGGREIVDRD